MGSQRFTRVGWVAAVVVLLVTLPAIAVARPESPGRPAPIGSDPFVAGQTYRGDFPDPSVMAWNGRYYGYSTSVAGLNLPVLSSSGLGTWTANPLQANGTPDALAQVPRWAEGKVVGQRRVGVTWAPSVRKIGRRFVAVYATRVRARDKMCISRAVASRPTGPFVDDSTGPLVCPSDRGAIDPMITLVDDIPYLLYKTEDVALGQPSRIFIRRMTPDGLRLPASWKPRVLLVASQEWERRTVENPAMIRYRGQYYLFYSGNGWASPDYSVGYARCAKVVGPCTRVGDGRLLTSGDDVTGPGGGHPFLDSAGRLRLAYHAWDTGNVGYPTSTSCRRTTKGCAQRKLHVATLGVLADGNLRVANRGATAR